MWGDAEGEGGGGGAEEAEPTLGDEGDGRGGGGRQPPQDLLNQLITQHHIHLTLFSSLPLPFELSLPYHLSRFDGR